MGRRTPTRRGDALIGCLIVAAIAVTLVVAGVVLVALNWRSLVSMGLKPAMDELVAALPVSDQEKSEVRPILEGLLTEFKNGKLGAEEIGKVIEEVAQSPLVAAAGTAAFNAQYVDASKLPDAEKGEARLAVQRLSRGLVERSIPTSKLVEVTDPIRTTSPTQAGFQIEVDGVSIALRPPSEVTDDQLREVVAKAKLAADSAGVAPEPYDLDVSAELEKAIQTALGRVPGKPAGSTPAPTPPAESPATAPAESPATAPAESPEPAPAATPEPAPAGGGA